MEKKTKTVTTTYDVYIANDGTSFPTKEECEYHEWCAQAVKVYSVSKRGQRSNELEIYSTQKLAEKAVSDSTTHVITEVYLDARSWNVYDDNIDIQAARKHFFTVEGYMGTDEECIKYYRRNCENT